MPQFFETDEQGWIRSEQLDLPRQTLAKEEIDSFLDFLFSDLARRPARLQLRETAAVVRYLRILALEGVPREVARKGEDAVQQYWREPGEAGRRAGRRLNALAELIWSVLLQGGEIQPCGRESAIRFLRRHAATYLALRDVAEDLAVVEQFEIPRGRGEVFRAPDLMSQGITVTGGSNPYLQDDLSDRIYAAHHALKRQRVSKPNARIVEALNRHGVEIQRKQNQKVGWIYADVASRVKHAERQVRRKVKPSRRTRDRKARSSWGDWRADFWIVAYHHHQQLVSSQQS